MRIMMFLAFLLAATPLAADTTSEMRTALDYYAQVWNENDIEAIEGYYHQDFVQISDEGTLSRKQQIDGIRSLGGKGGDRGTLAISNVSVKALGDEHAMAWGQMKLEFEDGSALESWFTTVYVKTPFGWKALLTRS